MVLFNVAKIIFLCFVFLNVAFASTVPQKIKAVATISIVGDVVKNVAQDSVDLTVLVGANGDAHEFEPTPADAVNLSKANIIFENGLFLEHWLNKLYESSNSKAQRVIVAEGVISRTMQENAQEIDPHAWQEVGNVITYTRNVRDALIKIDPANKQKYQTNAARYIQELEELDAWVKEQVKTIPEARRKLVTNHDALGYFAQAYGFEMIGAAIPSATTEASDPSAKQIVELLNIIKKNAVHAIFSENMANAKLVQSLAQEAGVVIAPELYTDALGAAGSEGETYIKMIRHNVRVFVEYSQ